MAGGGVAASRGRTWTMGIVAAAAVALLAVGLLRQDGSTAETRTPVALRVASAGAVVTTGVGERDSLRLPDGTRVMLAPASRLTVAPQFGEGERSVTLDGAALFDVRHDAARPFTVHADGAVVRDVGTLFTVRTGGLDAPAGGAPADGPASVVVSVAEGAVALRAAGADSSTVRLNAGDRGALLAGGSVVASPGTAAATDTAWVSGRLEYRSAPLSQVADDVHRWYGLVLRTSDSTLARRRLTASFPPGEPADRVLQVVALSIGATISQVGDTVVLHPAGRPR